jgi:secretion/DNA translocation related TadE-like protein
MVRPQCVGSTIEPGRRDTGSASIWVLACAALVMVVAMVVVLRTTAVIARHRAESAADEAALAAATQIGRSDQACPAAAAVARANGARLLSCVADLASDGRSGAVTVVVGVDVRIAIIGTEQVRSTARAGRSPTPSGPVATSGPN